MTDIKTCNWKPGTNYLASHADAERRSKRGERQCKCKVCGRWHIWVKPRNKSK